MRTPEILTPELGTATAPHRVAVAVPPGVALFDLAIPDEVFGEVRVGGQAPYLVTAYAFGNEAGVEVAGGLFLPGRGSIAEFENSDTLVIPAGENLEEPPPAALREAIRRAHARGARIVGLCTGAFTLAAAGLLDDQTATTHWRYADALGERYPRVSVDPAVLYTSHDRVFTSAGTAAAIDLCIEIVRRDHGGTVANELARTLVMNPHRAADQAQFVPIPVPECSDESLWPVIEWARTNLDRRIGVGDLADRAHVSVRTLIRRFDREYALTPSHWLRLERVRRAQQLLEETDLGIDEVARQSGFGTATSLRQAFAERLHTSPAAYRGAFRSRV
ncbi:GlxA family transcriptional regulator [Mycetocola saprophilus]|uniref:GlxA family transcriptional regulator n=1 Tax=Mycetocola saprophilus TaxID=76636 RepID=UPI00068AD3C4|nr:helix-turn-helix domain-containing protein [Mycetocola saprophilus]